MNQSDDLAALKAIVDSALKPRRQAERFLEWSQEVIDDLTLLREAYERFLEQTTPIEERLLKVGEPEIVQPIQRPPRGTQKEALKEILTSSPDGLERKDVVEEFKRRGFAETSVSQYLNRFAKKNRQGRWVWDG